MKKLLAFTQEHIDQALDDWKKSWFEDKDTNVLDWPGYSLDLNIIWHVWSYMRYQLNTYEQAQQSLDELWERVQGI
ncbi:hypothetical protein BGZ76_002848 [Entomortierella beljakovae]|nr:hypothetical protein BGZ76_002848 [Entomortierella beljakovae]